MTQENVLAKTGWSKKNNLKAWLIFLALGLAAVLVLVLPVKAYLLSLLLWVRGLGAWGPVMLAVLYVAACVAFLPAWIFTVGAGFLFGLGWGTATVVVGATLGCTAAFLIGRTLLRAWVTRWAEQHPKFKTLDESLEYHGFKIIFLLRLSPVFPFSILNYALGLTRVRLGTYVLASWLGMLPGVLLYVYLGTAARSLAELTTGAAAPSLARTIFFWLGLGATALATVMVTRLAGRSLGK